MARTAQPARIRSAATPDGRDRVIAALMALGFSQYEARTYAGLIDREPLTGYALAKQTQVPQPKVYETLGRLVERGAVVQAGDSPAKFVAVAPDRLLANMAGQFKQQILTAEFEISRLQAQSTDHQPVRLLNEASSWVAIARTATELIDTAERRIYISGYSEYLEVLAESLRSADERGIQIDLLSFGEPPLTLRNGEVVRHSSTEHMVFPHHQARHVALTCDGGAALWALAPNGDDWEAVFSDDDELLCALVKGFVRHDLFMNRVYVDFTEPMRRRYGAGLEGLFGRNRQQRSEQDSSETSLRAATLRRAAGRR